MTKSNLKHPANEPTPAQSVDYRLPPEYIPRTQAMPFVDTPSEIVYQPYVYALATRIAQRSGAKRIVDIGCGNGSKLLDASRNTVIVGVDAAHARPLLHTIIPSAQFIEADLEHGLTDVPHDLFDDAVVICSDVIEHLEHPNRLASDLAQVENNAIAVLISTPDRTRARGLGDNGPPTNHSHVREWTADEFVRFLTDCGMQKPPFAGYTINHDRAASKITILVIAGAHMRYEESSNLPKVAALINTFNEQDIIGEVLRHLQQQGVETHVFDNWSEDGTHAEVLELKRQGVCKHIQRFPESPTDQYLWKNQLDHVEVYARSLDADWILHYDADELRFSPWREANLRSAIGWIDQLGYNVIDFTIINFRYSETSKQAQPPYQRSLQRFEFGSKPGHFRQIKGWKNTHFPVRLSHHGGHEVVFPDRRIFPLNFLTKHYPLRNFHQANHKVFNERLPRFKNEREERGWHIQYDEFAALGEVPCWPERDLIGWHEAHFEAEYLVERLSGIGVVI